MEKAQTLTSNGDIENIAVTKESNSWGKYVFSAFAVLIAGLATFGVGYLFYTNPLVAFVYYAEHLSVVFEGARGYFLTPFVLYGASLVVAIIIGFIAGYMPQKAIMVHTNFVKSIPGFLKFAIVIGCIVSMFAYVAPQRKTAYIMAGAYLANQVVNSEAAQQVGVMIKQQLHNIIMEDAKSGNIAPDTAKYIQDALQRTRQYKIEVPGSIKDVANNAADTASNLNDTIVNAASEVTSTADKVNQAVDAVNKTADKLNK